MCNDIVIVTGESMSYIHTGEKCNDDCIDHALVSSATTLPYTSKLTMMLSGVNLSMHQIKV